MGKKAKSEAEDAAGAPGEEPVMKPAAKTTIKEEKEGNAGDAEEPAEKKSRKKKSEDSEDEEGGFGDEDSEAGGEEEFDETGEPTEETVQPRVPIKVTLPEERWSMKIKIDADMQETLDLVDLQKLFGAYMTIKKKFFDDLLTTMPIAKHYAAGKAIESVTGFDKQDWTKNSWILIMAKEAKSRLVFWMLYKRLEDLSGMLVAVGPNAFAESIMGLFPDDPDSRNEYLKKLMIWLTIEPSRWKSVGVFVPTWL
ncbi:MAG: hypothetical protein GYA24_04245 [Candidatus Lokiarchaeota archaeon]|nr:hypothetical protein [Candidatus Lokiarchaeota archaeon]